MPQRHQITENTTVVDAELKENPAQRLRSRGNRQPRTPQRHQITENAAVVDTELKENPAQRLRSGGNR